MGGDLGMVSLKKVFWVVVNFLVVILFLYMVIAGQMNTGLVKVVENATGVTRQGVAGLYLMLIGLCGLVVELYMYNRRHR